MKKKVLSMVLAGIMCVSILAGCGTEPTQEETAQNVTTQENSAMSSTESESQGEDARDTNMSPRQYRKKRDQSFT